MTPVELSRTVLHAVRSAVDGGELSVPVPARAVVAPPGPGGRGDYATNIALQLARPAGRAPLDVAEILRAHLRGAAGVADVEITGPGFLNIRLEPASATASLVREILDRRDGHSSHPRSDHGRPGDEADDGPPAPSGHPAPYGHTPTLTGQVIPLRIPYDMRAEVLADTLVRIIATQDGRAEVRHARPGEPVDLRPVPAPEDPAPLGPDAARWALLYPAAHDRPRITADHLLQRESNPLFRVRYARARARALTRNAARLGFHAVPGDVSDPVHGVRTDDAVHGVHTDDAVHGFQADEGGRGFHAEDGDRAVRTVDGGRVAQVTHVTHPAHETHAPLLRTLAEYPTVLTQAATHRAPDRLARCLVGVADALLAFQHTVLPLGDEKPSAAHRARLALAEAAGTVLAGGLSLLGISAPDYL
ncbi:ArgS-related anticodon-binding protein NrtL [Streptomyces sp. NPDC007264]|uniref:ArgS-related anticodon-binding protein NrtL n=1 Tax=Streptomyces sp. NPDC007264 TaxID=3364777 RepID=UPI0036DE4BC4